MSIIKDIMLLKLAHRIDTATETLSQIYRWLIVALVITVITGITARTAVGVTLEWTEELPWQMYGILIMYGISLGLLRGSHIRTDLYWRRWSVRTQATVDLVSYITLFFPSIGTITWLAWQAGIYSHGIKEGSGLTMLNLSVWPFKLCIAMGLTLLVLQGISRCIHCGHVIKTGHTPRNLHHEVDI